MIEASALTFREAVILTQQLIGAARLPLQDEKETQAAISRLLAENGLAHIRERKLAVGDVIDFFVPDGRDRGLAIEVKLNKQRSAMIQRQLTRYARHWSVRELMLVSNRATIMPATLNDKPLHLVSLGRAWL